MRCSSGSGPLHHSCAARCACVLVCESRAPPWRRPRWALSLRTCIVWWGSVHFDRVFTLIPPLPAATVQAALAGVGEALCDALDDEDCGVVGGALGAWKEVVGALGVAPLATYAQKVCERVCNLVVCYLCIAERARGGPDAAARVRLLCVPWFVSRRVRQGAVVVGRQDRIIQRPQTLCLNKLQPVCSVVRFVFLVLDSARKLL